MGGGYLYTSGGYGCWLIERIYDGRITIEEIKYIGISSNILDLGLDRWGLIVVGY